MYCIFYFLFKKILGWKVISCQYLLFTCPMIWLLILQCEFCRFDKKIAAQVAKETGMPFVTAPNKFEALVCLHWHLRVADYVGKLMLINAHLNGCFDSNLIFTKVLHCFAGSPWCICGVQWCPEYCCQFSNEDCQWHPLAWKVRKFLSYQMFTVKQTSINAAVWEFSIVYVLLHCHVMQGSGTWNELDALIQSLLQGSVLHDILLGTSYSANRLRLKQSLCSKVFFWVCCTTCRCFTNLFYFRRGLAC